MIFVYFVGGPQDLCKQAFPGEEPPRTIRVACLKRLATLDDDGVVQTSIALYRTMPLPPVDGEARKLFAAIYVGNE